MIFCWHIFCMIFMALYIYIYVSIWGCPSMSVMSFSCPVRPKLVGLQQGLTLNCPCFIDTYLIHVHIIMIYYVMCKTQSSFPNLHIVPLTVPPRSETTISSPRAVSGYAALRSTRTPGDLPVPAGCQFLQPLIGFKHHLLEGAGRIKGSVML